MNEESIESTMKENEYLDFQVDLKEPNQSIIHIKTNSILLNLQLTLSLKIKIKKAFRALRNKDASITSEMEHKLLDLQVSIKRI